MQTTGSIGAVWESKYIKDAFMVTIDILRTKFIALPNPSKWATGEGKRPPSHLIYIYKTHTGASALNPGVDDPAVAENVQIHVYQGHEGCLHREAQEGLLGQTTRADLPGGQPDIRDVQPLDVLHQHLGAKTQIQGMET